MSCELTLTLRNSLDEIGRLSEAVEGFFERHDLPPDACMHVTLALDELLTNAISYGFEPGQEYDDAISVVMTLNEDELSVVVEDRGRRFNPLSVPPPDTTLPLEDRAIGGLGLHFVREFMTSVDYAWVDGRNRLRMRKRMP